MDEKYLTMQENEALSYASLMLLVFVYEKQIGFLKLAYKDSFIDFDSTVYKLEERGLIKRYGENPEDITLRKAGEDLFKKYVGVKKKKKVNDTHVWFDTWRKLFPEGSNSAGYRYRGSRLEGLKKMTKFVDLYDYTREEIFQATENYVNRFAIKGYLYMQQAHFFIDKKDVGSNLASECEGLQEESSKSNTEPGYGRTIR